MKSSKALYRGKKVNFRANVVSPFSLTMMDEDDFTVYREENLFAEALKNLEEIRKTGRLCDIQLKVSKVKSEEKKSIPTHSSGEVDEPAKIV